MVFIDDLDRADPAVVPKLLLVLRELLDVSRFAFVLAFDRQIVATALQSYNAAWKSSGNEFLDKVIDFPFDLPAPSLAQIKRLALAQFRLGCPFVPSGAIAEIEKLLPSNPRKLKLFARMIASIKEEATRHEADELDWPVILVFALIRAESEAFANELLAMMVDTEEFSWARWAMLRDKGEQDKQTAALNALIARHSDLNRIETRITMLANGLRERCSSQPGERLRYQALFALSPHCITWGEFKNFFAKWRPTKAIGITLDFIIERAKATKNENGTVEAELTNTIISHYSMLLERAGQVVDKGTHLALMDKALDTLDLLTQCLIATPRACNLDLQALVGIWSQLLSLFMQWRHFNANEREPELRSKEADTLLALATAINDPLTLYERLKPWGDDHDFSFDGRSAELRRSFRDQIRAYLEPDAIKRAILFVSTPTQIKKLRSREDNLGARYFLTAPESPCFADPVKIILMREIEARTGTRECMQDALDWIDLLLAALHHEDPFCNADARKVFISIHADFVIALWSFVISTPSQFRFLQSLRERRQKLVECGVANDQLVEPGWLEVDIQR